MKLAHALLFLICLFWLSPTLARDEQAKVLQIVDGDTLRVEYNGKSESIRLIGVDAPERNENPKAFRDANRSHTDIETILALGEKSAGYLRKILPVSTTVWLEFDQDRRDKYGRLLAYVYLPNHEMLNEKLLRDGFVNLYTIPPNVKYESRFEAAVESAHDDKRGLWGRP